MLNRIRFAVAALAATAVLACAPAQEVKAAPVWTAKVKVFNASDANELVIGAASDASDGFDNGYEVRAILSSRLAAYFLYPEWGLETGYFWTDIKDTGFPKEWKFYVVSSVSEQIDMVWGQNVPENIQLTMLDEAASSVIDMKTAGSYRFTGTASSPRSFKVTASSANVTTPDTTAPDTQITSAPSGYLNTSSATVSFTATDNVSTALKYSYKTDENQWSSWSSTASAQLTLSDGSHVFYARSMDESGNIDPTPAQAGFTVDTAVPSLIINNAANTQMKSDRTTKYVKITGTVSDAASGLSTVTYKVVDEYGLNNSSGTLSTSSSFSFSVPIKVYCKYRDTNGRRYTITVTATDKAKNTTSKSVFITIIK